MHFPVKWNEKFPVDQKTAAPVDLQRDRRYNSGTYNDENDLGGYRDDNNGIQYEKQQSLLWIGK